MPTDEEVDLRIDLIREELNELEEACDKGTLVDVADAADILYVTYGAGHTFGIDLDKCFVKSKIKYVQVGRGWKTDVS